MKCAIITCSEYKRKIFSPKFHTEYISLPFITEEVLIVNLPYTTDKFYMLPDKKRIKLAEKLCRLLYNENIFCIYLAGITDCTQFSYIKKRFHSPEGKILLKKYAGIGACKLSEQLGFDLSETNVALYQKNFNHTGFEILCEFVRYFKNITIIGDSPETLDKYSNQIMDMYGISVNMLTKISPVNSCDLLFLLSKAENVCADEKTVIVDLIKKYPFHCLNSLRFDLPLGFNKLLPYFGAFDEVCMEFILHLLNSYNISNEDIFKTISNFGGTFKRFCAKKQIILDK